MRFPFMLLSPVGHLRRGTPRLYYSVEYFRLSFNASFKRQYTPCKSK